MDRPPPLLRQPYRRPRYTQHIPGLISRDKHWRRGPRSPPSLDRVGGQALTKLCIRGRLKIRHQRQCQLIALLRCHAFHAHHATAVTSVLPQLDKHAAVGVFQQEGLPLLGFKLPPWCGCVVKPG